MCCAPQPRHRRRHQRRKGRRNRHPSSGLLHHSWCGRLWSKWKWKSLRLFQSSSHPLHLLALATVKIIIRAAVVSVLAQRVTPTRTKRLGATMALAGGNIRQSEV